MRRTITTLNRFTTFITNWWANPRLFLGLSLLLLLSCEDDTSLVGIKNPNRDFEVFAKEFIIPTKVFMMDSLSTSYGNIAINTSTSTYYTTPKPWRLMTGSINDPNFGKTTATAYTPYWLGSTIKSDALAIFQSLKLTMVFDYSWFGDPNLLNQKFEVYALSDSMITYLPHYNTQPTPYSQKLGETSKVIDPAVFDTQRGYLEDTNTANNIYDSITFTLDANFGKQLFNLAMDTIGDAETKITYFSKFRRLFKGLAVVSPGSNKIVGFDPSNAKTRLFLTYKIDTTLYELEFFFTPSGQANQTAEYTGYTEFQTDRSGTPLAGLPAKYVEYEPADGRRYVQAGTGVGLKLDFTQVYDHFKDIPIKSLSVAELKFESDEQRNAPLTFRLQALKFDNRFRPTSYDTTNIASTPIKTLDVNFVSKHLLDVTNASYPYYKAVVTGDDGRVFTVNQVSNTSGVSLYNGYLTNFIEQELALPANEQLKYWALVPQIPDISMGVNGYYFPADKIKLKVYYTAPRVTN